MRLRQSANGLTVNAIAGSHVVFLGFNITNTLRNGFAGFAIHRTDHTEGESYWLKGAKAFASVVPQPAQGQQFSSQFHPFQSFQWADYSAKPGYEYSYRVVAMYGAAAALTPGASVEVKVKTETGDQGTHTINFNRGAVATQEYARKFLNQWPNEAGQAAYDWLSRGLVESITGFINEAKDEHYSLHGAFYEFQRPVILDALKAAKDRDVEVRVVFDDIDNATGPHTKNETAIAAAKLKSVTKPRRNGTLMHNKFLVLLKDDEPIAVLTGSTNLTENGLYGHANCTHIVRNKDVAAGYHRFYKKLWTDPETSKKSTYKDWTIAEAPAPAQNYYDGMAWVFSPRRNIDALEWYADLAAGAKGGLFMTFAFGMGEQFRQVYRKQDGVLRLGLMEKEWNGANKDAQIAAVREIQKLPNVVIAIGNRIPLTGLDSWLGEIERITKDVNVHWVHLKFMLVDPLSDDPLVVTGSANFSKASTDTNDENMLVIKGNRSVADIYFGEYMRLYSHYAFREAVNIFLKANPKKSVNDMPTKPLVEGADWTEDYFSADDPKARKARRLYFSGSTS